MSSTVGGAKARVLITGGQGFVGRRLTRLLTERRPDWSLIAPHGPGGPSSEPTLDVTDQASVENIVRTERPDIVVHLAAIAAIDASTRAPREAWRVNLDGTLNVVFALQEFSPHTHLLFISSAEVYGASLRMAGAADELTLLQPLNPYAASKAAADTLVRQAAATGLSTCVMRPFNHTGRGQAAAFVAPNFAGQIARIEQGLAPPVLMVGSLDDERDFLDVGDVALAYALALEARHRLPTGEVFNVASGEALRIGDLLEFFLSQARCEIEVKTDESRLRRVGTSRVVGNAEHLRKTLQWRPQTPLKDTLFEVLQEQREHVARASLSPGVGEP